MFLVRQTPAASAQPQLAVARGIPAATTANGALIAVPRTSRLPAPTMLLTGHASDVLSVKFSPDGELLASGGHDKTLRVWRTFAAPGATSTTTPTDPAAACKNILAVKGHQGAVLDVQWSVDGRHLFTASSDWTVGVFDAGTGERVKRCKGHRSIVNACAVGPRSMAGDDGHVLASCDDDGYVLLWDTRKRDPIHTVEMPTPVTTLVFDRTGEHIFFGGVDNMVHAYDVRAGEIAWSLQGHADTVTGLSLSGDGERLLSNSMDNTLRIWDVKPFSNVPQRQLQMLQGAPHALDKNLIKPCWSPDGTRCASGAGDRTVVIWDAQSAKILYKLPGHRGTVNEVTWHPHEPIIASGSTDRLIYVGEIEPRT